LRFLPKFMLIIIFHQWTLEPDEDCQAARAVLSAAMIRFWSVAILMLCSSWATPVWHGYTMHYAKVAWYFHIIWLIMMGLHGEKWKCYWQNFCRSMQPNFLSVACFKGISPKNTNLKKPGARFTNDLRMILRLS